VKRGSREIVAAAREKVQDGAPRGRQLAVVVTTNGFSKNVEAMVCEALEFSASNYYNAESGSYGLTARLIKAHSIEKLLEMLISHTPQEGWRLAVIGLGTVELIGQFRGEYRLGDRCWNDSIVYVGEKKENHSITEYFFGRRIAREQITRGRIPLVVALSYHDVNNVQKGLCAFFRDAEKESRNARCLLVAENKIYESLKEQSVFSGT
jgi:hypothetical protein